MAESVPEVRPDEFVGRWWWGAGASAVQTEGACPADDWYRWERAGCAPASGAGNGFATRFADDFALLCDLGITDYRLSINWGRVYPTEGQIELTAVDYYRSVLAAGCDAGLRIWVCLLHSAIPVWFADRGGFTSDNAVNDWLKWVDSAARLFGDLAGGWMPFNEPSSYAQKAYLSGSFPPGHQDLGELVSVLGTVQRCDFEAALRLRETGAPVCSNQALLPLYPADEAAVPVVAQLEGLVWDSWLSLARDPRYAGAFDLYGFAYYYGTRVTGHAQMLPHPADQEPGPLGYVPWPDGIVPVLDHLHHELPGARFVVAEIGYGGADKLDDQERCDYLLRTLRHIAAAQDKGMRIEGVSIWTAIDNYEWLHGFDVPFGLFTRDREPRCSAEFVRSVIQGR